MHLTSGGTDRDELGVEFYTPFHIERQSTAVVEIGTDGRQHSFDEIDVATGTPWMLTLHNTLRMPPLTDLLLLQPLLPLIS